MNEAGLPVEEQRAPWSEVVVTVVNHFSARELEEALGEDFGRCLPAGYETEAIAVRLPRHVVNALQRRLRELGRPGDFGYVLEMDMGAAPDIASPQAFLD